MIFVLNGHRSYGNWVPEDRNARLTVSRLTTTGFCQVPGRMCYYISVAPTTADVDANWGLTYFLTACYCHKTLGLWFIWHNRIFEVRDFEMGFKKCLQL